jgi:hypothetical protein
VFVAPILLAGGKRLNALETNAEDTLIATHFKEW